MTNHTFPASGMLARRQVAASLEGAGEVVRAAVLLYTAPLGPQGRLLLATGEQVEGQAIDEGLLGEVQPIHHTAARTGNALQVG